VTDTIKAQLTDVFVQRKLFKRPVSGWAFTFTFTFTFRDFIVLLPADQVAAT
jgi:hypothetical protein